MAKSSVCFSLCLTFCAVGCREIYSLRWTQAWFFQIFTHVSDLYLFDSQNDSFLKRGVKPNFANRQRSTTVHCCTAMPVRPSPRLCKSPSCAHLCVCRDDWVLFNWLDQETTCWTSQGRCITCWKFLASVVYTGTHTQMYDTQDIYHASELLLSVLLSCLCLFVEVLLFKAYLNWFFIL